MTAMPMTHDAPTAAARVRSHAAMAVIVSRGGAQTDADSLVRLVNECKGAQHARKHVAIVDALPLTALGKVDKKALRARCWAGLPVESPA
jgi:non-ribosomal peptide synthetase component E (peptide arylation enzyme)